MDNQFLDGLEFGCMAAWFWYLFWLGLVFYVAAKTHNFIYVFGTASFGLLISIWLKNIVKPFILKR